MPLFWTAHPCLGLEQKMTRDQIAAEKTTLQKVLLHFENLYGRPGTEEEKHILRPLYERYRIVKQLLSRARNFPTIGTTAGLYRHVQLKTQMDCQTAQVCGDIQVCTLCKDDMCKCSQVL
uniref:Uncharacterized protein n=1 Tax=Eptatretus burgeri TaxID=7764 RepID=A0A8C4R8S4_EPTBU